eukprot:s2032_g3.t2
MAFATATTKDDSLLEVVAGRGARVEKLAPQASANAGRSVAVPGHCGHQLLNVLSAQSASRMFGLTPQALANAAQWWGTLSARKRKLSDAVAKVLVAKSRGPTPRDHAHTLQDFATAAASLTPTSSTVAAGLASRDPHPSQEAGSLVWCIAVPDAIGEQAPLPTASCLMCNIPRLKSDLSHSSRIRQVEEDKPAIQGTGRSRNESGQRAEQNLTAHSHVGGPRAEQQSAASHGSVRRLHLKAPEEMSGTGKDAADPGEHYAFLLKKCVKVVETYDPKKTTIDAYMEDAPFLKDKKLGDTELKFIHQVFYGCMRYNKFLKLFITSFMYKCPAAALRAEQNIYLVLAYLLFFRLEELTVPELRQFLLCGYGAAPAINALMQYALSVEELEKWVKVEWCKFYDVDYVEQDIIGKLQSFKEELQTTSDEVEFRATGTVKAADGTALIAKSEKKLTEFKPFKLTQPRPRLIPEPDVISRQVKAQPVPTSIHKNSLNKVEEQKKKKLQEEKAKVLAKYDEADHFNLETASRRDHEAAFDDLKKQVESERMAECTFFPKTEKKAVAIAENATVRHNVASVLREDALVKQKQAKEYQALKRYEEDLHDASQFYTWQEKMKEKDHNEEEMRVRQRIVEMQLSRGVAMEAFDSAVRKKHILAEHQREELQVELDMQERMREHEMGEKKQLVEETKEESSCIMLWMTRELYWEG